jgi:hypothetical protein
MFCPAQDIALFKKLSIPKFLWNLKGRLIDRICNKTKNEPLLIGQTAILHDLLTDFPLFEVFS